MINTKHLENLFRGKDYFGFKLLDTFKSIDSDAVIFRFYNDNRNEHFSIHLHHQTVFNETMDKLLA